MTETDDDGVALLIDGSALFLKTRARLAQRHQSARLDYTKLDQLMRRQAGLAAEGENFDPAIFFTTVDRSNDGQVKFLKVIEQLGWDVEALPLWEADPFPRDAVFAEGRNEFIRFDSSIAFALGYLSELKGRIVVVSDSYGLAKPLQAAASYGEARIVLAFYRQELDPRWSAFLNANPDVEFWDLEAHDEELFGIIGRDDYQGKPVTSGRSALARLR